MPAIKHFGRHAMASVLSGPTRAHGKCTVKCLGEVGTAISLRRVLRQHWKGISEGSLHIIACVLNITVALILLWLLTVHITLMLIENPFALITVAFGLTEVLFIKVSSTRVYMPSKDRARKIRKGCKQTLL